LNISTPGANDTLNFYVSALKKEPERNETSANGDGDDYRNPRDLADGSSGATGHYLS